MIRIINGVTDTAEIFSRSVSATPPEVEAAVDAVLADVRARGDAALLDLTERFDGVRPASLRVTEEEIEEAFSSCPDEITAALSLAAANIREFHSKQLREGFEFSRGGAVLGQRVLPLASAGLYIPGGTASYPSTVLMSAIPAHIAGVGRIVMVTPPGKDGKIAPAILAAARIAGVTEIYTVGGAQAIAALAYGTETVKRVDKIVGPGNIFVATAKKKVFGLVDIDMIAGPSEILVVADGSADPKNVAADMLSQAEHDRLASAVLVCTDAALAEAVSAELERQIPLLPRAGIARESVDANGKIIVVPDVETAVEIANEIAPEHLELCVEEPFRYLGSVRNAGSVFLGAYTPEALGDYWAGPNHTLPTMGTARFSSPLSVDEFIKRSSYICYTEEALRAASGGIAALARSEGLEAHARSVEIRFEGKE
ncbi:MAG: histidinol dehydrogenase [Oscillospiraceae bacterium]|nr:histidinol dehydrogenase [Oscillospiraceae bacterium]